MNTEELLAHFQKIKEDYPNLTNDEVFKIIELELLLDIRNRMK